MYKVEEETTNHLLLHYSKAKILWQLVFSLFGATWVMNSSRRGTLLSWHGFFYLFIYFFFFYGKEVEESLEGHSFVYILNATDEKII